MLVVVFVIVCWLRSGGEHCQPELAVEVRPRLAVEDDAEDEKDEEEQEEEGTS